ncbi:polysaccharide biosynthesis protein [Nocardioides sp.]|uniref:polysaccharide biosynthesis protein n=1 Tax=Nocardioides sp. TaxID=35761 RepID=UPI003D127855
MRAIWIRVARALRVHRTRVLMLFDAGALLTSYVVTLLLHDEISDAVTLGPVAALAIAAVVIQWSGGLIFRVYSGRVAVASIEETILLGLTTVGGGVSLGLVNMTTTPLPVARSLPFTATFMALFVMMVGRAAWRHESDNSFVLSTSLSEPALIVGAGWSGRRLAESMLVSDSPWWPVGFLDDDDWKRHRKHYGVAVLGGTNDLAGAVEATGAECVVIAIPSASADLIKRVSDTARGLDIAVKVLPSLQETFSAGVDVKDVRDVEIGDLLGRSAIETDIESIAGYLTGKRVLVTGAGGSIGSELCRQIDRWAPAELIMLDRDESALHAVQLMLHGRALLDSPEVVLNDIRDEPALREVFLERRPHVVFHAAALKHLPMLEQYPVEAMKTNVLGTANVLAAAAEVGVQRFVNISTDKAADPTSVLGYSKRVAERLTSELAGNADGSWISVRFGNVLGSRGSVLMSFASQIASGGPVTVTDPEVTRYFMTVEEAVQLVIQAGAIGCAGDALVLDMGQPVKILDVAQQLIEQSGRPVEIIYTGLRGGEKLHEKLFGVGETDRRPEHPLISHVAVPPLCFSEVRSLSLGLPNSGMLSQFKQWMCVAGEPVAASATPGAREWLSAADR